MDLRKDTGQFLGIMREVRQNNQRMRNAYQKVLVHLARYTELFEAFKSLWGL